MAEAEPTYVLVSDDGGGTGGITQEQLLQTLLQGNLLFNTQGQQTTGILCS